MTHRGFLSRFIWQFWYIAQLPLVALRLRVNDTWRWVYRVSPAPIQVGDESIWVSAALGHEHKALLPKFAAALARIAVLAPSRYARLHRLRVELAVLPMPVLAAYMPRTRVLAIDTSVLQESDDIIAGILVHELSHALMASKGFVHPMLTKRMERIATMDQLLFAARLDGEGLQDDAMRIRHMCHSSGKYMDTFRGRWKATRDNLDRLDWT